MAAGLAIREIAAADRDRSGDHCCGSVRAGLADLAEQPEAFADSDANHRWTFRAAGEEDPHPSSFLYPRCTGDTHSHPDQIANSHEHGAADANDSYCHKIR